MASLVLDTVRSGLGVMEDSFDEDILTHVNAAVGVLNQLGVDTPLKLIDAETRWESLFHGEVPLYMIQAYILLKVRLMFDPPSTSFAVTAMENQAKEYEQRINYIVDPVYMG